jgi:adenylate kinase
MNKRVILITGTPCTGKTTLAKKLATKLNAQYINLTELAQKEHLATRKDKQRDTNIINETKMQKKLQQTIKDAPTADIVIDGHYAAAVTPKTNVTKIFVLRRNPIELQKFMQNSGFSQQKQDENLAAEILDVCLIEALQLHPKEKVCELDVTGQTVETTLKEVLMVLDGKKECSVGAVDWLGMLEQMGKVDEFLKT